MSTIIRTTPLSVKLEAEEKNLLTKIAKEKACSVHSIICQAVREYIEREQARLNFFEDGRKAIEHYDQTGLHVTHEEMRLWAESLGGNNELTPPVCHE
jgi:predicted transcriptional regulator